MNLSEEILFSLILTAVITIVLGMGLPVAASYVKQQHMYPHW